MGGTLGRCGSPCVENIYDFFPTIANLIKSQLKKTETFLKLRADRYKLFTASG